MTVFFWDSNLFIYLIEQHPVFCSQVSQLRQFQRQNGHTLVTSTLTYGEAMVYPFKTQNQNLIRAYQRIFLHSDIVLLPLTFQVAERFAQVRAEMPIKPPDALQLACAASHGVDYFITNDHALTSLAIVGIGQIISIDTLLKELKIQ